MGIFDVLKKGYDVVKNKSEEMQSNKDKFQSYSDSRLSSIARSDNFSEKIIAYSILKERLGEERAKEIIKNN